MKRLYAIALLTISILAGCAGEPPKQDIITTPLLTERSRVSVKRIKESAQHQIIGYLEEAVFLVRDSDVSYRIYYIKNKFLKLIGFVTEKGQVYRYDKEANAIYTGDFILDVGIRRLLKFTGTIYFEDFEAPPFFDDD